jgi:hypothetical protein
MPLMRTNPESNAGSGKILISVIGCELLPADTIPGFNFISCVKYYTLPLFAHRKTETNLTHRIL